MNQTISLSRQPVSVLYTYSTDILTTYVLSNLSGPSRKSKNPSVVLYPSPPLVVRAKSLVSVLVIPPSKLIICGASSLLAVVKG